MREIKVRAWDKKSEKMWYWNLREMGCNDIGELKGGYYCGCNDLHHILRDCPIMLDTGLRDKNGKEIYSGDILQYWCRAFYSKNLVKEGVGKVEWQNGQKFQGYGIGRNTVVEVIGNIYENPELLKKI